MSPGSSKLNPYAAAYVPLSRKAEDVSMLAPVHSDSSKAFAGSSSHDATAFHQEEGHRFYGSSPQECGQDAGNQGDDVQHEMDLAYLQAQFPTISEQSLNDVYFVNGCDLDAAYDMLNQLESLPDSLDIGDVSEPQILPEFANLKLKEVSAPTGSVSADSPKYVQPQN